jgi:hypothetical protein
MTTQPLVDYARQQADNEALDDQERALWLAIAEGRTEVEE